MLYIYHKFGLIGNSRVTNSVSIPLHGLSNHSIMEATERIQAASNFLLQSPPGEINDVLNGSLNLSSCSKHSVKCVVNLKMSAT
jgi:hypothetical protein